MDVKVSTQDVDFTGPQGSIEGFREVLERLPHGFKVDTWMDGYVFTTKLPDDYLERSVPFGWDAALDMIDLRALDPVDLVVSKIGRFNERDRHDIRRTHTEFDLDLDEIRQRAEQAVDVANEELYTYHLELVLQELSEPEAGGG